MLLYLANIESGKYGLVIVCGSQLVDRSPKVVHWEVVNI